MKRIILGCVLLSYSCNKVKLEENYEQFNIKPQTWCAYENFEWINYSFENPIKGTIKNTGRNLHRYFIKINKYDELYNEYLEIDTLSSNQIILPETSADFSMKIKDYHEFIGYGIQVYPEFYGECAGIKYLDLALFELIKETGHWIIKLKIENGEKFPFNGRIKLHFTKDDKVVSIHTLNTCYYGLPSDAVLPVQYIVQTNVLKGADSVKVVFSDLGI